MKTIAELRSLVGTGSCKATVFPVSKSLWCHPHATGSGQADTHVMLCLFHLLVFPLHTQAQSYGEFAKMWWCRNGSVCVSQQEANAIKAFEQNSVSDDNRFLNGFVFYTGAWIAD